MSHPIKNTEEGKRERKRMNGVPVFFSGKIKRRRAVVKSNDRPRLDLPWKTIGERTNAPVVVVVQFLGLLGGPGQRMDAIHLNPARRALRRNNVGRES